jgi:phosphoribosylformylglycinamidine synthase
MSALLGAFRAQMELGIGSIGGKDSMSGTFEDLDVPPTLVSFAVTAGKTNEVVSPEFKSAGNKVYLITPEFGADKLPKAESLIENFNKVTALMREGKAVACYTPGMGGVAEAVMKMCFGNMLGFEYASGVTMPELFGYSYGSFVIETTEEIGCGKLIGTVTDNGTVKYGEEKVCLKELLGIYEDKLESVFSCNIPDSKSAMENFSFSADKRVAPAVKNARPKVLIPAFPGTNCEFDSAKAMRDAGADAEIIVINNLSLCHWSLLKWSYNICLRLLSNNRLLNSLLCLCFLISFFISTLT